MVSWVLDQVAEVIWQTRELWRDIKWYSQRGLGQRGVIFLACLGVAFILHLLVAHR